jgi:folylpolyglutamate synthase/dihydropteroate synthase
MLTLLRPRVSQMIFTKAEGRRSKEPSELQALWPSAHVTGSVHEAIELARAGFNPGDTVVVCGSLYLIGEARTVLQVTYRRDAENV